METRNRRVRTVIAAAIGTLFLGYILLSHGPLEGKADALVTRVQNYSYRRNVYESLSNAKAHLVRSKKFRLSSKDLEDSLIELQTAKHDIHTALENAPPDIKEDIEDIQTMLAAFEFTPSEDPERIKKQYQEIDFAINTLIADKLQQPFGWAIR